MPTPPAAAWTSTVSPRRVAAAAAGRVGGDVVRPASPRPLEAHALGQRQDVGGVGDRQLGEAAETGGRDHAAPGSRPSPRGRRSPPPPRPRSPARPAEFGASGYRPRRATMSAKLSPAARTAIRTCPGPRAGSGRSSTRGSSGEPCPVRTSARTRRDLHHGTKMPCRMNTVLSADVSASESGRRRRPRPGRSRTSRDARRRARPAAACCRSVTTITGWRPTVVSSDRPCDTWNGAPTARTAGWWRWSAAVPSRLSVSLKAEPGLELAGVVGQVRCGGCRRRAR